MSYDDRATDLETSPYPLVYPLVRSHEPSAASPWPLRVEIRTLARALNGMQKEALTTSSASGRIWRMACDEGPYLNGTDLAPFPLAFFTTGLVNSYFVEILKLARLRGIAIGTLELVQDNLYTMEGSAVRGDMLGGASPVALQVRINAGASDGALNELVAAAVARSPADAFLRGMLESEFSIAKNGEAVAVGNVRRAPPPADCDLSDAAFDAARPDPNADLPRDIITKLAAADSVFGVEGGAGSSLRSEQKRTLHVRGIATLRADGLTETRVQLFKPIGSSFRFLCDLDHHSGSCRAPSPLEYLSAGIAFCYLTQIGRYAAIMKHRLERYAIAQCTAFTHASGDGAASTPPSANAVRTHVEIAAAAEDATVRQIVDMGERTCFLHAAARTPLKTRVRIEGLESK
jgi:uncharacterized OsmC-like protein